MEAKRKNEVKFYLAEGARLPEYSTLQSACFDIRAHFDNRDSTITLRPGEKFLVPTGLFVDLPEGYSLRIHARSGLAARDGLTLINGQGIIDADYVDQIFVALINLHPEKIAIIQHGDRIAQGEIVKDLRFTIKETKQKPALKGNRTGGFGSTGKS